MGICSSTDKSGNNKSEPKQHTDSNSKSVNLNIEICSS